MKKSFKPPGFPTGVENIGGGGGRGESSKFDEWGLSQYRGKGGGGLKCCQTLIVKLPTISLQA